MQLKIKYELYQKTNIPFNLTPSLSVILSEVEGKETVALADEFDIYLECRRIILNGGAANVYASSIAIAD